MSHWLGPLCSAETQTRYIQRKTDTENKTEENEKHNNQGDREKKVMERYGWKQLIYKHNWTFISINFIIYNPTEVSNISVKDIGRSQNC